MRKRWSRFVDRHETLVGVTKFTVALATCIVVFFAGLTVIIRQFDHHYTVNDCRKFAESSNYETKFVDYSFWTWDCLVKSGDRWVPMDLFDPQR